MAQVQIPYSMLKTCMVQPMATPWGAMRVVTNCMALRAMTWFMLARVQPVIEWTVAQEWMEFPTPMQDQGWMWIWIWRQHKRLVAQVQIPYSILKTCMVQPMATPWGAMRVVTNCMALRAMTWFMLARVQPAIEWTVAQEWMEFPTPMQAQGWMWI